MIKDLKDIKKEEVNLFGGKATNLGFLMQNGFNVPEGFCISTKINKIDKKTENQIIKKFQNLKSAVAVRSSATSEDMKDASFAGQFDTFLNIKNERKLLNSIEKCWNSVKSKRAISYLRGKNLKNIKMAVIVQKIIHSDFAGVIFTLDPISEKNVLIEFVKGLGDKLVSGRITPSSYLVDRSNYTVINKSGNTKIKESLIKNLAKAALQIEELYNFPQDIEFAIDSNKIYILQSRPITTLGEKIQKKLVFEKSITRDWSVIFSQIWHEVFTKEFKKQFGFRLTEVIYEGKNNVVNVYRAPDEYIKGMRNFISNKIESDSLWINKQAHTIKDKVLSTINWINKIRKKSFSKYDNRKLAKILNEFVQRNVDIGPRYIIMLWFPIQLEQIKGHKYKNQLQIAKKTRKDIHILSAIANNFTRDIAKEVLKRAKLPYNLAKYITYQEILDYLIRKKINKNVLLKRKKYFIITNQGILYEPIKAYLKKIGHEVKNKTKINSHSLVSGVTAYPGFVHGKARVIINIGMFKKFKNKDVLVTTMTTPDFVPLLKKSAAFVTDEGGITCHAAIISRELKIPCIIGTKVATKVLKDNDFVEVDANNGVVKIIK